MDFTTGSPAKRFQPAGLHDPKRPLRPGWKDRTRNPLGLGKKLQEILAVEQQIGDIKNLIVGLWCLPFVQKQSDGRSKVCAVDFRSKPRLKLFTALECLEEPGPFVVLESGRNTVNPGGAQGYALEIRAAKRFQRLFADQFHLSIKRIGLSFGALIQNRPVASVAIDRPARQKQALADTCCPGSFKKANGAFGVQLDKTVRVIPLTAPVFARNMRKRAMD